MSFVEFFLLLCFTQSLLLAVCLLRLPKNKTANRLLALQSLVWGTMCYYRYTVFQDADYILQHHLLLKFNNVVFLLFFVFPFLYVKYMTLGIVRFRKKDLLHFLPAILAFLALTPFFLLPGEEKIKLMLAPPGRYLSAVHFLINNTEIVQGIVYVALSMKYIRGYHRQIKENYSNIDHLTIYWLRNLIILIFAIWLIGGIGSNLYAFHLIEDYYFNALFFLVGGSIYGISYYLLTQRELFTNEPGEKPDGTSPADPTENLRQDQEEKKEIQLDDAYCDEIVRKLTHAMETDKMFLNQNLSLDDVVRATGIPRHHISLVLNKRLNNTFFDYINRYRVEEVKRRLQDPQTEKLTLLAVSFEAGFNSKATFNRSFKKYENMTPQEYKNQLRR